MPLNHQSGEPVEGMDLIYRVVPVSKYQEQARLTTPVEEIEGKKFKRKVVKARPIFDVAWQHAQNAFANSGAPAGTLSCDIICQEYPRTGIVLFLFAAIINGKEMLVPAPFKLADEQIADLAIRGLWKPHLVN
jgi:hypothetical protein